MNILDSKEELAELKELFKNLEYKYPGGLELNELFISELYKQHDYDDEKVKEVINSYFPLTFINRTITSDRRYDRYYSILYQHNISKRYYLDVDCLEFGGDAEFKCYYEHLKSITDEEATLFINWCNRKF